MKVFNKIWNAIGHRMLLSTPAAGRRNSLPGVLVNIGKFGRDCVRFTCNRHGFDYLTLVMASTGLTMFWNNVDDPVPWIPMNIVLWPRIEAYEAELVYLKLLESTKPTSTKRIQSL